MLTRDELAVVRAALRYWIDEVVPNGQSVARFYFDRDDTGMFAMAAKMAGSIGLLAAALHLFVVVQTNLNFRAHPSKFIANYGHGIHRGFYSMFFRTQPSNLSD